MQSAPQSLQPHCTHTLNIFLARHSFRTFFYLNSRKCLAVEREESLMARPSPAQANKDISSQFRESTGFSGKLMCKSFFAHSFSPEKSTTPRRWEQAHLSKWQLSWNNMQLLFLSMQVTLPGTERNPASFQDICS